MNTNNTTANTTTFPDSWYDLWKSDQPLDFEAFLNSDVLVAKHNQNNTRGVFFHTLGTVSTIASTCLVLHILRSHHGLSTTYHRLVFGLFVADILSSFGFALGSTMVPKEMNYYIPSAQGNTATCTAQGFLLTVGVAVAALYNCSICLYYLSIIRYNKKDEYIRNKLEPWFHGISIIIPLVLEFIIMTMKGYNASGGVCFLVPNDPPHCIGYESGDTPKGFSIPCGRGDGGENPILYLVTSIVGYGSTLIITPTVIVGTMILMYRSVSKIEKNMRNYGVGALRLKVRPGGGNRGDAAVTNRTRGATNDQGIMSRIKRSSMRIITPCLHSRDDQPRPTSRSKSRATSQIRAILHMAAGYALAWAFVFIPFMISFFFINSNATKTLNACLEILHACLGPLQGLFNFLVYMSPKVRNAKRPIRGRENLSWRQAFIKAFMSRGERRKTGRNLSSGNNRTVSKASAWKQSVKISLNSLRYSRTITRDTTRSSKNNESSTNARTTKISGPAGKLTPSNPHLADGDMKEAEGSSNNAMRPQQQQELLATDGDDEEKCEEQKALSHLDWIEEDGVFSPTHSFSKTRTLRGVVDDFV